MINCSQCGAKYREEEGFKYCVQCGTKLGGSVRDTVICVQCNNSIKPATNCSVCGLPYTKTELLLLKEIRNLKNTISTINRVDINRDLLDDVSVPSISDLNISQQQDSVQQSSDIEEEVPAEPQPDFNEVEVETNVVSASASSVETVSETVSKPKILNISKPKGLNFEYQRERIIEPIDLPGFTNQQTVIEEKTFIQRAAELVEGPFLTVMGVFTAVMTMIFFAQVVGWTALFQGYVFSIIGTVLILTGYSMVIGKFPFFGPERGLGLLVSSIGFVLAEVFALGTGDLLMIAVVSIVGAGLVTYIGFKQYSEVMLVEATTFTILLPILMGNLSGLTIQIITFLSLGGGSIFLVSSGLIALYSGKREVSYYPALINLALGPVISLTIINNFGVDIIYPSLGIVLSIIPTAMLLFEDKILILDFYYDLLLKFIVAYPVVLFFTLHFNESGLYRELDPLIFLIGYMASLAIVFYSTDSFSPVFTQLKQSNMNIVTAAIPIVTTIVGFAIMANYIENVEWSITIIGFVGMAYLIPVIYNQYDGLFLDFKILDGLLAVISGIFFISLISITPYTDTFYLGVGGLLLVVAAVRFTIEHIRDDNSVFDNEAIHLFIFLFILNFETTNQSLVLLPMLGLFVIPLLFNSVNDLDRLKSFTNLVVTNIAILSSYFLMTSGYISEKVQFNFLTVILTFVSAIVISGGVLYTLRLDRSNELSIEPTSNLFVGSYRFLLDNLNVVINIGIQAVFLSYLVKIYEIIGTDVLNSQYLLIIISSVTAITLVLLVTARHDNWMAIIPGLFTLSLSFNLIDQYTILTVIFGLYIGCSLLLNSLDRLSKQTNVNYRIFFRDLTLWSTFIFTIYHTIIPNELLYIIYGGLIGHAVISEILRINSPLNSITLVFGTTTIVNMLNQSVILTYMAYASISLSIAFFVLQSLVVDDKYELIDRVRDYIGNYLSVRYIFPLIGLSLISTTSTVVMSPLIISCIFIATVSGMLILTKSHNLAFTGLALISTILLQQFPIVTEQEVLAIIGTITVIGIAYIFSVKDKFSGIAGSSLAFLLLVPANVSFGLYYQITVLCIVGITLIIDNYKGREYIFDYLPLVLFGFFSQFMELSTFFFVPSLILVAYSLIPVFSSNMESQVYSDSLLAVAFAFMLIPIQANSSIISIWVLMISGIIAIVADQYLQKEDTSWLATAVVVTVGSAIFSFEFIEITLIYFALHFIVLNISKLQDVVLNENTQYVPVIMMAHLILVVEPTIIYPIMAISGFLIYSYAVNATNLMEEINSVGLILFAALGIGFPSIGSISLEVTTVLVMLSVWLYRISNSHPKDKNPDLINIRNARILGILQLALVSVILWNLDFMFTEIPELIVLGITMLSFSYFIWSKSSDILIDTITVISLAASALLVQDMGALIILGALIINIIYLAMIALVDSDKISMEELSIFGMTYVVLGALQSFVPYVNNIGPDLIQLFDNSWVITFTIWISVTLYTIFNSDLSIKIGEREIILNSVLDIVIYSMAIQGIVMISWSNLTSITSLLVISNVLSLGIFIAVLLKSEIAIDKAKPIDRIFASFFILLFAGMLSVEELIVSIGTFDIEGGIIFILFSILPIVFSLIIYTNRGYRNLELEQIVRERLFVYVLLAFLASVSFMDYTIDLVPIMHFATALFMWSILLIAAWNNDVILTTIGSIYVYTAAYFLGNHYVYSIADAQFTASIPIVIFIALTVVMYLFRAEFEYRFQQGHHPLLLVSIGALIFTSFQTDNFRLLGSSTSVATTMVTVLFSLVGALVYIYGTKFRRGKYQGLGIMLIFLNLTRGLLLFLSRIAGLQESTEANAVLSLISFLWATIMIGIVGGIRSLSKRDDLNRVLSALFKPIDRSVDQQVQSTEE